MRQETSDPAPHITLFVCSGCTACNQAAAYLREWASDRPAVTCEIASILDQPGRVVRLGITQTPALVADEKLVAQSLSRDTLADLLIRRGGFGTSF